MNTSTTQVIALWEESRTRLEHQLGGITAVDLTKKIALSPNRVGFLLQHLAEVELLFAKKKMAQQTQKLLPELLSKNTIREHGMT
jgi:hypothetical protein